MLALLLSRLQATNFAGGDVRASEIMFCCCQVPSSGKKLEPTGNTDASRANHSFPCCSWCKVGPEAFSKDFLNTGVIDFEFFCVRSPRLFPGYPQIPFNVAMSNARGDWIIPATGVNYNVSVRSMLEEGCALRSQYVSLRLMQIRNYAQL